MGDAVKAKKVAFKKAEKLKKDAKEDIKHIQSELEKQKLKLNEAVQGTPKIKKIVADKQIIGTLETQLTAKQDLLKKEKEKATEEEEEAEENADKEKRDADK